MDEVKTLVSVPWTTFVNTGTAEEPQGQFQFYGWSFHKSKNDADQFIIEMHITEELFIANGMVAIKHKLHKPTEFGTIMNRPDYSTVTYDDTTEEALVAGFLSNPNGIMYHEWCPEGFSNDHINNLKDLLDSEKEIVL